MENKKLPLQELSIGEIYNGEVATYEVPIYQRNYAWEKDEITALVQDVFDAFTSKKPTYYIGTLVTYHKGDQIYEVIDGQQRLTTINLALQALNIPLKNKLSYRARKKSDATLRSIPNFETEDKDDGIINGFYFAKNAIDEIIIPKNNLDSFKNYFQNQVHLIHYQVPKDIDLNHYFEVMNSRGEQLEKHEVIKARLIQQLDDDDKKRFNKIWENCSEMNVYIQQKYRDATIFGKNFEDFIVDHFDNLPKVESSEKKVKIKDLLESVSVEGEKKFDEKLDSFQPIIDFSNFLLIILKLTRMEENDFSPTDFTLDDKELIKEFDKVPKINNGFAKKFGYNLLKGKYFLDNYIVHHSNEDEKVDNNPWKLQYWQKVGNSEYLKSLGGDSESNKKLVQLLSMFEVSFTARQRKNYLFYCLSYLFESDIYDIELYCQFVSKLAEKYFKDVYLVTDNLSAVNTPIPGSFDREMIKENKLNINIENTEFSFEKIYGDGSEISTGIPLFIFNYLDFKIWEKYFDELKGEKTTEGSRDRKQFFEELGSSDFGLQIFRTFYFSRTRRSLEHFFPTANVKELTKPTYAQINCFGNYAMIGSEVNSAGSNWSPKAKLVRYLDESMKVKLVSVASLKFMIMMQMCKDNEKDSNKTEWNFDDISKHQEKMLDMLK